MFACVFSPLCAFKQIIDNLYTFIIKCEYRANYERIAMKKETISEKQIIKLIKACPHKDNKSLEIWERCMIYNDYCVNCLMKCDRMRRLLNNTEIKTRREKTTQG